MFARSGILTSLIAVTSAFAVGSPFLTTVLWQLMTASSLRTTAAPKGPPSARSTPSPYKNSLSLSRTAVRNSRERED